MLGNFARNHFDRINGRIKYKSLHEEHIACFGDKYVHRFKNSIAKREKEVMRQKRLSIISNYNNVIVWRHQFAHEGQVLTNATYKEIVEAYEVGKEVVNCLAGSMRR